MINKHMKRCSTSRILREMHIKMIMRYCLVSIRVASITKQKSISVPESAEELEPLCTVGGNAKPVQLLQKTICRSSKNENRMII